MLDRWAIYTTPLQTVAVGSPVIGQSVRVDAQPADFYLRGISIFGALNQFRVKIRRPDGNYLQSDYVDSNNIETNEWKPTPLPIWPPVVYPFGSVLAWDITNPATAAPDDTTYIVFAGSHRYLNVEAPPAPAYNPTPYQLCSTITLAANQRVTVPLRLPFENIAFAIRTLCVGYVLSVGPPATSPKIQLRDENGRSFMNDYVDMGMLFQSDNRAFPGLVSPEAVIPPNGSFRLDLLEPAGIGPTTFQLKFGGVLLNAV